MPRAKRSDADASAATGGVPGTGPRVAAVAIGGALGTLARYELGQAIGPSPLGFPWPTFLANVIGSFLLGAIMILVVERWSPGRYARPFAAIGFCGGFTTFSTMAVETAQLARHDRAGIAAAYLVSTMAAGLLAAALGIALARWKLPLAGRRPIPDPDDLGPLHEHRPVGRAGAGRGPGPGPAAPWRRRRRRVENPAVILVGLAVAGSLGAVLRYVCDHLVQRRAGSDFPVGIMVVNLTGSLVLGVLVGTGLHHGLSPAWVTVIGTGLIGSYTTFSTFTFDTVRLAEDGLGPLSVLNAAVSVVAGLGAAAAGLAIGSLA